MFAQVLRLIAVGLSGWPGLIYTDPPRRESRHQYD
jgi:hypothetical protein